MLYLLYRRKLELANAWKLLPCELYKCENHKLPYIVFSLLLYLWQQILAAKQRDFWRAFQGVIQWERELNLKFSQINTYNKGIFA